MTMKWWILTLGMATLMSGTLVPSTLAAQEADDSRPAVSSC